MADDEIDNLRKLLQPHLWRPVRGKTAKGFPRKDKFDYQLFAHEEGITEAAAYKMMSRLRTDKVPGILRRVGGLAALRTLASRALAWMRSLANRRGFIYASAGLATILILILMRPLLNDQTESTTATELLTVSSLIATQAQGQSTSPADLNQSQPDGPDNTQVEGRAGSNLRAEPMAYPNMPTGIASVEVLVFYREDKMNGARKEAFSQTFRRFVKSHSFSSVRPQATAARNDVKGVIFYDADAGSDMRECAEFVRTILNEAESGLSDKFYVMGVGGGGIGGADSAPSTQPSVPVLAPRVVKVTLPEVYLP